MWKLCLAGASILFGLGGPALAKVVISVDVFEQKMTVAVDGTPKYTWPVSTGAPGYTTPPGIFGPTRLVADHYSREWDDAPMPHSIFFTEQGHAIHGTTSVSSLGVAVSHGCVRLAPENARLLFGLVEERGVEDAEVEIFSSAWKREPYESFGIIKAPKAGSFGVIGGPRADADQSILKISADR